MKFDISDQAFMYTQRQRTITTFSQQFLHILRIVKHFDIWKTLITTETRLKKKGNAKEATRSGRSEK